MLEVLVFSAPGFLHSHRFLFLLLIVGPFVPTLSVGDNILETPPVATSIVAEVGSFKRFSTPREFMAYVGLIPSEYSSGERRMQGNITKTGNRHVRRLLVESAWSYRYQPAVKGELKRRQSGQSPTIQAISWKAQNRLHKKYYRLLSRGKEGGKAITAVARELAGFIWAVMQEVEETPKTN